MKPKIVRFQPSKVIEIPGFESTSGSGQLGRICRQSIDPCGSPPASRTYLTVFGGEKDGIAVKTADHPTLPLTLPARGNTKSLNVANRKRATTIMDTA
ncbi:hypothetical protein E0H39_32455 [Rhizobium leguminosarum bv. viciae]|nr:hypothetical protein [Rhizobium leguminosarum bv. viciae]PUB61810.1 hypothetical protein DB728_25715 [Rhizobium leguminosarum bv. viciae USDA 2370]NKK18298.1 hypothetical protein [Rhizobium leguminosarum bv. viciae]NKK32788.1 hypothetical protein [Rhizobium leguminosarum bv. viciae]NKK39461.1 hypothetical protein [Rhizobium leguminosarum bv. viciae]